MPVEKKKKTLPKKAQSWIDYAVEQYYEVYKPRGYTYSETLKELGEKKKGKGSMKINTVKPMNLR